MTSPVSTKTKKVKPVATQPAASIRERLIAATLELAKTMSLHEMSQARIAAAAGVRQSHLTYYFPTRVDLIKAVVVAIRDQMTQIADLVTIMNVDKQEAITAARSFFADSVCELPKARMMLSLMLAADEDPSLRTWLEDIDRESIKQMQQILLLLGFEATESNVEMFQFTVVGAILNGTQIGSEAALKRASRITAMAFDHLIQCSKPVRDDLTAPHLV